MTYVAFDLFRYATVNIKINYRKLRRVIIVRISRKRTFRFENIRKSVFVDEISTGQFFSDTIASENVYTLMFLRT